MDAPDLMEEAARQRMARDEIGRLEEEEDGTVPSGPQVLANFHVHLHTCNAEIMCSGQCI